MPGEPKVIEADVPMALYDEWRQIIALPRGLTLIERGHLLEELFAERRDPDAILTGQAAG